MSLPPTSGQAPRFPGTESRAGLYRRQDEEDEVKGMSMRTFAAGTAIAILATVAAACAGARNQDQPGVSPNATPAASAALAATGDTVLVRRMDQKSDFVLLDADTGKTLATLPWGATGSDGKLLYRAEFDSGDTVIRQLDLRNGKTLAERRLDGPYLYELPTVSLANEAGGLSPNVHWIALRGRGAPGSAFAIVDGALREPPRFVRLDGNFAIDAISDSGKYLYLEEYLGSAPVDGYRVRAYDLAAGKLLPGIVVDKTATADKMQGTRAATFASPDGQWQYTLYTTQGGKPFIHAIKLDEAWSLCIFFPVQTSGEEQLSWTVVQSADRKAAYVVNTMSGYVAALDTMNASVVRTVTLRLAYTGPSLLERLARLIVPVAEAKGEMFATGALSPDGRTLYLVGDWGARVYVVDTDALAVRTRFNVSGVMGLGVSADGSRLYATSSDGALLRLDLATGAVLSRVGAGIGLARLLRVASR